MCKVLTFINIILSFFLLKCNETLTSKCLVATNPFTENLADLCRTVAGVMRSEEEQACPPGVHRVWLPWSRAVSPLSESAGPPPVAFTGVPGHLPWVDVGKREESWYKSHSVLAANG